MQNENKITLTGTVVCPPELIYLSSGDAKLSVQIEIEEPKVTQYVVSRKFWKYKVVVIGSRAEQFMTEDRLQLGTEVRIKGQIYTWSWKPPVSDQWMQRTEILAESIEIFSDENSKVKKGFAHVEADLPF